jgi:serine/threonine protein kinase
MSFDRGSRFGHYEIAALIDVGGMGEVYRATDTTLKRDVALKVLPDSFVTNAALNHPNVAQIYARCRSSCCSPLRR